MRPLHPAAGRLLLDMLWWTAGAETSARGIHRRTPACARLVCTAYHSYPGRTTCRPILDSTIWCWLMLSVVCQDELTPTPTTVRQHKIDPLFMLDLLPLAPPDDPSCGSSGHEW